MGKIREIPSIIYIVSGNSFPKTIILKSKSFNKIYNMIPRKDNEVIVNDRDEQDKDQVKELEDLGVKVITEEEFMALL